MVDRQLAAEWKNRLAGYSGLKVGLVWAGNPSNQYDSARSCSLQDFASLAAIDGVIFFSLQKGPAEAQLSSLPHGMQIIALGSELKDFADTAAAIESLDIVPFGRCVGQGDMDASVVCSGVALDAGAER
jgi:hypothetical protein